MLDQAKCLRICNIGFMFIRFIRMNKLFSKKCLTCDYVVQCLVYFYTKEATRMAYVLLLGLELIEKSEGFLSNHFGFDLILNCELRQNWISLFIVQCKGL